MDRDKLTTASGKLAVVSDDTSPITIVFMQQTGQMAEVHIMRDKDKGITILEFGEDDCRVVIGVLE